MFLIGADHKLAVHAADQYGTGGAVPRDIAHGQGDGRADHGRDFRGNVLFDAQDRHDNLDVIAHALFKQGPQGTVDQTAGQGSLLRGAPLPLDETAGDLANGILLFFHVHCEREEVNAVPGGGSHCGVYHHDGVAQMHPDRAVGLFTIPAELQRQRAAGKIHCVGLGFHTFHSFYKYCFRSAVCYHMKTPPGIFKG